MEKHLLRAYMLDTSAKEEREHNRLLSDLLTFLSSTPAWNGGTRVGDLGMIFTNAFSDSMNSSAAIL